MADSLEHVPNQILLMIKSATTDQEAAEAIAKSGATIVKQASNGRLRSILIEAKNIESTIEQLKLSNCFDAIQPNYVSKIPE